MNFLVQNGLLRDAALRRIDDGAVRLVRLSAGRVEARLVRAFTLSCA